MTPDIVTEVVLTGPWSGDRLLIPGPFGMVLAPENNTTNEAQVPLAVVVHEEFVVDETTLYEEAKLYPLKGAAPTAPALDHCARTIYLRVA